MFRQLRSKLRSKLAKLSHSKAHADNVDRLSNADTAAQIATLTLRLGDLSSRYEQLKNIDDLNEAIVLCRDILSLCPPGHPGRSWSLSDLAARLSSRYEELRAIEDLNEAIAFAREALSLRPPGHPDRSTTLKSLAADLSSRYKQLDEISDLNEALTLRREALSLIPPGHPNRSECLLNLAVDISSRYERLGVIKDLNEAIIFDREALPLCPPGHPHRIACFINLTNHLSSRYKQLGEIDDLNECIVFGQEALSLFPPEHPYRSIFLNNLASHLSSRYELLGKIDDLNKIIVLGQEALSLRPPGHPSRSVSLNDLAARLALRYQQLGENDDLNEALALDREALSLFPSGHPYRPVSLNNLSDHLSSRYEQLGRIDDLNEAIVLSRDALSLSPPEDSNRSVYLNNLASHVSTRYEHLGGIDDLDEAITVYCEALSLRPHGHPGRSISLNNLAVTLVSRSKELGAFDDLNEAIALGREALLLAPSGHPGRSASLNNLASHLFFRNKQLRNIEDLNEAILLSRNALSLCPPGHFDRSMSLNNLAAYLSTRYEQLMEIADLNEAIVLGREALSLFPPGHPSRSASLNNLADHLSSLYKHPGRVDDAMEDRDALFTLYAELQHVSQTVTTYDLFATRAWTQAAEAVHHPTTLSAYETALRLLVEHSAALPPLPQHLALLKSLSSSLAADAFSACLRNKSPFKAVELLEQGRGVFWSQLSRFRSTLDDVVTSGPQGEVLADEFTRLTSLIHMALRSPSADQHDRVWGLNLQLKKVVSDIRGLPGHSRFLLPPLFSDIRCAARDGPVIIVNASRYGCDALIMFADKDPVHIPLPVTKEDVRGLSQNLHTLRKLVYQKRMDVTTGFRSFLRELWDRIVSYIVDVLRRTCLPQSRIWWCPTAEFSLLPLHAAAPYRKDQESVSDLFVSSYTTTLTALIRARRPAVPKSESEGKHFIAIGQAQAPGFSKLHFIHTELANIQRSVKALTTFTRIQGRDGRVSTVAEKLHENEWAHFACHGFSDQKRPFESAFALRDGPFTIQRIIQSTHLRDPEFAYLSACHTTVGDQEHPDEVIHLASAMQFAGFRSVVGTIWSVADSSATKIASAFYELMVNESGCLDHTRAAWALWKTLKTLDISIDQRILYIHLGA